MPVDPDLKSALEQISKVMPEFNTEFSAKEFRDITTYDRSFGMQIDVKEVRDISIPVSGTNIKGRLYSNDPESESMILYYHGGGFVIGSIDAADAICRMLAVHSHSKVISVDYRLAPEYKFPVPMEDSYDSYKWVRENAQMLGIDPERIAVSGDSAGGNLSASLCLKALDNNYPLPRLNVMFYPVVTSESSSESFREYSDKLVLTRDMMVWFHSHYMRTEEDSLNPYFSPLLSHRLGEMPETIVITAEFDPLRDQGETFVSALRSKSVEATGIRAMGMVHGFLGYFPVSTNVRNILVMASSLAGKKLRE